MKLPDRIDRRELFRTALRGLALVMLGGGGLALALRGKDGECPPRTACDACRLRDDCGRKPRDSQEDRTRGEQT